MELSQLISLFGPALPCLLAGTGLFFYLLYKIFAPVKSPVPPGPSGVTLFFDILKSIKGGTLHLLGEKWARQYGEIVMCRTIIGSLCFLNSARLVRQVFTDKRTELFSNDRPKMFTAAQVMYNFKDVSFSDQVNNKYWLKMRKLLHSTVMITGEDHSQDSKVPQMVGNFAVCLQKIMSPTVDSVLSAFPFLRFLPGTYYKELCENMFKSRDMLMEEVVTKAKAKHVPGEPKGMVGSLFEAQMKNSSDWLTDDHIRGMLLNIISAAFVTSTELLKSFFLYMAHYPQVMEKIQQEIDSIVGHRSTSLDDRRSLHFTEAVILEVIRKSSNVPLGVWHETREDILADGFCIPRGTVLFENIWWMNMDPKAWEDPEVFRPERFLDDEGQLLPPTHPTRWRFLPFGIGKRSCPGESFARSRAFLYVTTLLQKFDFLPPVNHDLRPLTQDSWTEGLALQLKPCNVAIKRRSKQPQA